jgi:hypothetical protein
MGLVIVVIVAPILFVLFGVWVVLQLTLLMLRLIFVPVALLLLLRR